MDISPICRLSPSQQEFLEASSTSTTTQTTPNTDNHSCSTASAQEDSMRNVSQSTSLSLGPLRLAPSFPTRVITSPLNMETEHVTTGMETTIVLGLNDGSYRGHFDALEFFTDDHELFNTDDSSMVDQPLEEPFLPSWPGTPIPDQVGNALEEEVIDTRLDKTFNAALLSEQSARIAQQQLAQNFQKLSKLYPSMLAVQSRDSKLVYALSEEQSVSAKTDKLVENFLRLEPNFNQKIVSSKCQHLASSSQDEPENSIPATSNQKVTTSAEDLFEGYRLAKQAEKGKAVDKGSKNLSLPN